MRWRIRGPGATLVPLNAGIAVMSYIASFGMQMRASLVCSLRNLQPSYSRRRDVTVLYDALGVQLCHRSGFLAGG